MLRNMENEVLNSDLAGKNERIKKEYQRLSAFYQDIDENQRGVIDSMLQNLAFMCIELEDLKEIIKREGTIETYKNGENQKGVKATAHLQAYNSLIKSYDSIQTKLIKLLPKKKEEPEDDLDDF